MCSVYVKSGVKQYQFVIKIIIVLLLYCYKRKTLEIIYVLIKVYLVDIWTGQNWFGIIKSDAIPEKDIEKKPNEEIIKAIIFHVQLKFWPLQCGIRIEHLTQPNLLESLQKRIW